MIICYHAVSYISVLPLLKAIQDREIDRNFGIVFVRITWLHHPLNHALKIRKQEDFQIQNRLKYKNNMFGFTCHVNNPNIVKL